MKQFLPNTEVELVEDYSPLITKGTQGTVLYRHDRMNEYLVKVLLKEPRQSYYQYYWIPGKLLKILDKVE